MAAVPSIPENEIAGMVKGVLAGDYRKFVRVGAGTLANVFGGPLARAAVDGILDRVWKKADAEKAKAKADADAAEEVARISAAMRDALRTELTAVVEQLDGLSSGQAKTHSGLAALHGLATRSADDLAEIREQIDALTTAAVDRAPPPEELLVHLANTSVRVPPFADGADVRFTVHNFTHDTLKLRDLRLVLVERTEIDEVELPTAGEPIADYELNLGLSGHSAGTFHLLEDEAVQFVLQPDDADGFRLKLTCDDGYRYGFRLSCTGENVRARKEWASAPVGFEVTAPVTRPETLRARRKG